MIKRHQKQRCFGRLLRTISKILLREIARGFSIGCEGWRQHFCLIFLILLFVSQTKYRSKWLSISNQNALHSHCLSTFLKRVSPPSFTLYGIFIKLGAFLMRMVDFFVEAYTCLCFWKCHSEENNCNKTKSSVQIPGSISKKKI